MNNFDLGSPSKINFEEGVMKYAYNWREGGQFSVKDFKKGQIFMLANIIYVVVAIILIFVLYLAVKAITRGVEAKSELSKEKDESDIREIKEDLSTEISKLKKMHEDGVITQEEFKKAKEKILK